MNEVKKSLQNRAEKLILVRADGINAAEVHQRKVGETKWRKSSKCQSNEQSLPSSGEPETVSDEVNPKRARFPKLRNAWIHLENFETAEAAKARFNREYLDAHKLIMGTKNERSQYFKCQQYKNGCTFLLRLNFKGNGTANLWESSTHCNHHEADWVPNRGLSEAQKALINEAIALNINQPKEIVEYFRTKRRRCDDPINFPPDPERIKLINYKVYNKRKRL